MIFAESVAKNGEKTFSIDSVFFHSSYAPSKEIERVCSSIPFTIKPGIIILIEPGLNNSYYLLKKIFPDAKIGIIRLIPELKDTCWDFIFNYSDISSAETLKNKLLKNFSESELLSSVMFSWPTADKLFSAQCDICWNAYKEALIFDKTILVTRQYFEKKWFVNSLNFIKYANKFITLKNKINTPVVITASGPSLKSVLPLLQQNSEQFFLIALSSSVTCLLERNIIPDLIMTTDGGFWAGEHLKQLKKYADIPIAAVPEAYIPKQILQNNPIVPLYYNDQLINEFFTEISDNFLPAQRNGTISGTALEFAKNITTGNIYFCGLDLQEQNGYQHTQCNELEINNSIADSKLKSKEKRIYPGSFKSESLQIYRNWFENYKNTSNIFRIIDDQKNNRLGTIKDITTAEFSNLINKKQNIYKQDNFFELCNVNYLKNMKTDLSSVYEKLLLSEKWLKQLFPIDYLSINHVNNIEDKKAAETILKNKKEKFLNKIKRNYE